MPWLSSYITSKCCLWSFQCYRLPLVLRLRTRLRRSLVPSSSTTGTPVTASSATADIRVTTSLSSCRCPAVAVRSRGTSSSSCIAERWPASHVHLRTAHVAAGAGSEVMGRTAAATVSWLAGVAAAMALSACFSITSRVELLLNSRSPHPLLLTILSLPFELHCKRTSCLTVRRTFLGEGSASERQCRTGGSQSRSRGVSTSRFYPSYP